MEAKQVEPDDVVQEPRVEEVIVAGTGAACPSRELLTGDRRTWVELRVAHEDAYLAGEPIARCAACHQPVKPRMSKDSRRFFWHFHKNAQCPYQGKTGPSQRVLDAMRYNGQKEGPAHLRLKRLLAESLAADRSFDGDTLAVERRWWGVMDEGKWRTPDVSVARQGVRIAFEVQLSSTYLNVMRERHRFYLQSGGLLFWVFREVQTIMPRQMQDDIFYWNNSNLFVVDEETRRLSVEGGELVLRCHYLVPQFTDPEEWRERLVRFSELTLDLPQQRAYFFDNAAARQAIEAERTNQLRQELRERYIALWTRPAAGSGEEFARDYLLLTCALEKQGINLPIEPTIEVKRFTWLCLSAAAGTGVGLGYNSLLQVANYAFDNCPELVHYFLAATKRAGLTQLLLEQDEAAGAKRRLKGKSHDPWSERIQRFRSSYQLAQQQQIGPYPVERCFDSLFELLFALK